MNQLRVIAVSVSLIITFSTSSLFAEENPADFKQSRNAWVVWAENAGSGAEILVSQWEKNKWGAPEAVGAAHDGNGAPAIAVDASGNPAVVWSRREGGSSTVYFSRLNEKKWSEEVPVSQSANRENVTPAIALNGNGEAIVAWGSVGSTSDSQIRARILSREGNWGEIQTLTDEDNTPDMVPSVAFSASGKALVAWVGKDREYVSRLYGAWLEAKGNWTRETLINTGDPGFGEDLPSLKVEGESLKLYFEEGNRLFAASWTGKSWTSKKWVDLSNSFYNVFDRLEGEPYGRAWLAWTNAEGKPASFRYNIVSHDVVLGAQSKAFHYISRSIRKTTDGLAQIIGWVLGESDAFAGGSKKKKKKAFLGPRSAIGDSITAGIPSAFSWVPFWGDGNVQNLAVPGERAAGAMIKQSSRVNPDTLVVVIMGGTNDLGDGRSTGDIVNALNSVGNRAASRAASSKVYICTGTPRTRGPAFDDLAEAIRAGSAFTTIETFNPLNSDRNSRLTDGLHLTEATARTVGSIVSKAAQPK